MPCPPLTPIRAKLWGIRPKREYKNKHLLKIKEYNKIKILKPEEAILYF